MDLNFLCILTARLHISNIISTICYDGMISDGRIDVDICGSDEVAVGGFRGTAAATRSHGLSARRVPHHALWVFISFFACVFSSIIYLINYWHKYEMI